MRVLKSMVSQISIVPTENMIRSLMLVRILSRLMLPVLDRSSKLIELSKVARFIPEETLFTSRHHSSQSARSEIYKIPS